MVSGFWSHGPLDRVTTPSRTRGGAVHPSRVTDSDVNCTRIQLLDGIDLLLLSPRILPMEQNRSKDLELRLISQQGEMSSQKDVTEGNVREEMLLSMRKNRDARPPPSVAHYQDAISTGRYGASRCPDHHVDVVRQVPVPQCPASENKEQESK